MDDAEKLAKKVKPVLPTFAQGVAQAERKWYNIGMRSERRAIKSGVRGGLSPRNPTTDDSPDEGDYENRLAAIEDTEK